MAENKIRLNQLNTNDISGYIGDVIAAGVTVVGSPGATGPAGVTGGTGEIGPTGATGPEAPGPTGPIGNTGGTGEVGPTGPAGATGSTGDQGSQGVTGPAGPQGSPGAGSAAAGSDTYVQYNHGGSVAGDSTFVFNHSTTPKSVQSKENLIIDKTGIIASQKGGGKDAYMYVDDTYDDFIIRKEDQNLQFIIDGDLGNIGLHLPVGTVPAYALDVSGEANFRGDTSQALHIEHVTDGTIAAFKNSAGSTKVKITSYTHSWFKGGKVGINTVPSDSTFGQLVVDGTISCSGIAVKHTDAAPGGGGSAGSKGEIRYDSDNLYICVDTDTWKKVGLSTF